jgi:uncharacterized protein YcbK (DUF882 family)
MLFMTAVMGGSLWASSPKAEEYKIADARIISVAPEKEAPPASGEQRSLSFYNTHTGEELQVVYRQGGSYSQPGLDRINHILRDHRRNETTAMSVNTLDLLYDIKQELNRRHPGKDIVFNIISGYRSPATNALLIKTVGGQSAHSRHMHGEATDIRVPGVNLKELRNVAWCLQRGGVGYYPGSDFVHVDTYNVRFWGWAPNKNTCARPDVI